MVSCPKSLLLLLLLCTWCFYFVIHHPLFRFCKFIYAFRFHLVEFCLFVLCVCVLCSVFHLHIFFKNSITFNHHQHACLAPRPRSAPCRAPPSPDPRWRVYLSLLDRTSDQLNRKLGCNFKRKLVSMLIFNFIYLLTDGSLWRDVALTSVWSSRPSFAGQTIWTHSWPVCSRSSRVSHCVANRGQSRDHDQFSLTGSCQ